MGQNIQDSMLGIQQQLEHTVLHSPKKKQDRIKMEISCSKCLENITEDSEFSTTHCGHTFHTRCILSWLRTNEECSECGKPCTNEQVYRIYPNKSTDNKENEMITTLLENASIKSTDLLQSEKQSIENKKMNEENKENKTMSNLIENTGKKSTDSLLSENQGTESKQLNEELENKNKMIIDLLLIAAKTGCVLTYKRIIEKEEDKNPQISGGQTLLHLVVKNGHENLCEKVIDNLLDKYTFSDEVLNTLTTEEEVLTKHYRNLEGKMPRNFKEQTPLHICAIHGHVKIFKLFMDKLIDNTSWLWAQLDDRQWTPLHHACMMGNVEISRLILENYGDHKPANYVDLDLQIPLHVAAYRGHLKICKLLCDHQSPLDLQDSLGFTPLHIAAHRGNEDICKLFIDRMVNKKPKDSDGRTPLHVAAFEGHYEVCKMFVDTLESSDEYLNPVDCRGWTPLHSAAFNGSSEICYLLLQNVSDPKPKCSKGLTPFDIAKQGGHKSATAIFKSFYNKIRSIKKKKGR